MAHYGTGQNTISLALGSIQEDAADESQNDWDEELSIHLSHLNLMTATSHRL